MFIFNFSHWSSDWSYAICGSSLRIFITSNGSLICLHPCVQKLLFCFLKISRRFPHDLWCFQQIMHPCCFLCLSVYDCTFPLHAIQIPFLFSPLLKALFHSHKINIENNLDIYRIWPLIIQKLLKSTMQCSSLRFACFCEFCQKSKC